MLADTGLVKGARSLWEEKLLLDYTIEVEDQQFKVHKVVMASVSDYFRAMLTGGMTESRADRVKLQGFSINVVSDIINFIYTGQLAERSVDNLKECLDCAVYLQIPAAVEKCTHELCEKADEINCLDMLTVLKSYSLSSGIKSVTEYIKLNLDAVFEACISDNLSHDQFQNLIECWQKSEWDLFVVVKKWISADYEKRKTYMNELMGQIRFCRLSPNQLASIKEMDELTDSVPWHDLVEKAVIYHNLPTHQKVLHDSEQTQCRRDPSPFYFMADSNNLLDALYKDRYWHSHESCNTPAFEGRQGTVVVANNFIILCDRNQHCNIFDAQTLTWYKISNLQAPVRYPSLVHHERHLYAIGGIQSINGVSDTVQRYDFEMNTWKVMSSKLPEPRAHCSAFSISGSIYVVGGTNPRAESPSNLHCYKPSSDTWESKAPLTYSNGTRLDHRIQVLELFGETIITVLSKDFTLQYYKPSTDQWSVWTRVGVERSNLEWVNRGEYSIRIIARGNCLFLLNFKQGNSPGGCEKWTFAEKGLDKIDCIQDHSSKSYFCVLLAIEL